MPSIPQLSCNILIAIDSWIDSNLIANLHASQFFSIMADECVIALYTVFPPEILASMWWV